LGGISAGLMYAPVVQAVMAGQTAGRRGVGAGTAALGLGLGALTAPPCVGKLSSLFRTPPTSLGPSSEYSSFAIDGKLYAAVDGFPVEVLEACGLGGGGASDCLYLAGTGSSGAAEAIAVLGGLAAAALFSTRYFYRTLAVESAASPSTAVPTLDENAPSVQPKDFHLLGVSAATLVAAGTCMGSIAYPVMGEMLTSHVPALVTPELVAQYAAMLTASTIGGSVIWGAVSDRQGCRATMYTMTVGSIPLFIGLPVLLETLSMYNGAWIPLSLIMLSTCWCGSLVGGVYGVMPPYLSQLFGQRHVGRRVGAMLAYTSGGALAGQALLPAINDVSARSAYGAIVDKIPPDQFQAVFGEPFDKARELIASHSISLEKLCALSAEGCAPSWHVYDQSVAVLAVMLTLGSITHTRVFFEGKQLKENNRIDITRPIPGGREEMSNRGQSTDSGVEEKLKPYKKKRRF
jgi:hypothetical protein